MPSNTFELMKKWKREKNPHMHLYNAETEICQCNTFWYLLDQNETKMLVSPIIESRNFLFANMRNKMKL